MNKKNEKIILFCIALLLFSFKHFLISNLPAAVVRNRTDDRLMLDTAAALRNGHWLGEYKAQLLMKGVFYPAFLAFISKLKLNYLCTLNFLNAAAALFFVRQTRNLLKNPVLRLILFGILLFDPCTFSEMSFQRIYRSSISEMLVLFLWGSYIGIYCSSLKPKEHFQIREITLILTAGAALWALWNNREESFWVVPFIAAATLLTAYRYWKAGRDRNAAPKSTVLRCVMLLVPFVMLFTGNQINRILNKHYYGEAVRLEIADGAFGKALKSIYAVKNEKDTDRITVSREKLDRILAVSPTLQQIFPELETEIARYDQTDRHRNDGTVDDSSFYWTLKYASFNNGAADTLQKSQSYWNQVHQEVEAALDDPLSSLERQNIMPSALMSPMQKGYLKKLPETFITALRYLVTYAEVFPLAGGTGKSDQTTDDLAEALTHNIVITADEKPDAVRIRERLPYLSASVKWLTHIGDLYRMITPIAAGAALLCFLSLVFRIIIKKQSKHFVPCIVICGMMFSMFVFTAGVSYHHLSALTSIRYHYLSSAYPLMIGTIWFTILYTIREIQEKRAS